MCILYLSDGVCLYMFMNKCPGVLSTRNIVRLDDFPLARLLSFDDKIEDSNPCLQEIMKGCITSGQYKHLLVHITDSRAHRDRSGTLIFVAPRV